MTDRRDFLRYAMAVALGTPLLATAAGKPAAPSASRTAAGTERKPAAALKLLIIGSAFAGTAIADRARARGHAVTVAQRVTRGDNQKLKLDAQTDLPVGDDAHWDAVIDTSAHVPMEVELLASLVKAHAGQYLLLSSTAVYARLDRPGVDETGALATTTERNIRQATNATASALLVLCEKAAAELLPDHVCIVRAGLAVGPGDPSGRFTYWPMRIARGGEVLAPGTPADPVQFIDVRDLADFVVLCAEDRRAGVYNADGAPTTMGALLEACRKAAKSDARLVWVDWPFIQRVHLAPYRDLPVWAPALGEFRGFGRISSAKAQAAGLRWRPLAQTVADTLQWYRSAPAAHEAEGRAGLSEKREKDLLKLWRAPAAPDAAPAPAPAPKRRRAQTEAS